MTEAINEFCVELSQNVLLVISLQLSLMCDFVKL